MSAQVVSDYWLVAGCFSPLTTGCCWQWRRIFLSSGGFCGVLCSRFSLSTPQRWPISGIRVVHRLPPWFSDSIGPGSLSDGFALRVKSVPTCLWLWFVALVSEEFSCVSFCASERLSAASRLASFIFFSFLLFDRALFLTEPSDSFGSQGYLWDESQFCSVL